MGKKENCGLQGKKIWQGFFLPPDDCDWRPCVVCLYTFRRAHTSTWPPAAAAVAEPPYPTTHTPTSGRTLLIPLRKLKALCRYVFNGPCFFSFLLHPFFSPPSLTPFHQGIWSRVGVGGRGGSRGGSRMARLGGGWGWVNEILIGCSVALPSPCPARWVTDSSVLLVIGIITAGRGQ